MWKKIPNPPVLQTTLEIVYKLPIPAFLLYGDDLRIYYNDSFSHHLDLSRKMAFHPGVPVQQACPECLEKLMPLVKGLRGSGVGIRSEQAFFPLSTDLDGEPVGWTYHFEGIADEEGTMIGILVTCIQQARQSTTVRRLLQDELEGQRRIYEAISSSTPDLMYVLDLNYKFLYANKALLTMWGRSWADSMGLGLQRSNDDLLQFAHVASHDLKEPTRKVKFFADLEVLIRQKEAHIDIRSLPSILGAPVLLYQLFYNLINNSLKFTRPGIPAAIIIEARTTGAPGHPAIQIDIRDNGIGFPQAYAEKIFSTCNPGEGAVFQITLPSHP